MKRVLMTPFSVNGLGGALFFECGMANAEYGIGWRGFFFLGSSIENEPRKNDRAKTISSYVAHNSTIAQFNEFN